MENKEIKPEYLDDLYDDLKPIKDEIILKAECEVNELVTEEVDLKYEDSASNSIDYNSYNDINCKLDSDSSLHRHTEKEKFECCNCNYKTTQKDCITVHMKIHDDAALYFCDINEPSIPIQAPRLSLLAQQSDNPQPMDLQPNHTQSRTKKTRALKKYISAENHKKAYFKKKLEVAKVELKTKKIQLGISYLELKIKKEELTKALQKS